MGKLKKGAFKFILCFVTGIISGVLIGISALSIMVSYRMDNHYKQITYLENVIQDKDARLEKLEESINTQGLILKDIEISLTFTKDEVKDEIDNIDIEKTIKEKYSTLLGKEVEGIDADLLVQVADKRILKIEDREYKLQVNKIILTEVLKVFINVDKID